MQERRRRRSTLCQLHCENRRDEAGLPALTLENLKTLEQVFNFLKPHTPHLYNFPPPHTHTAGALQHEPWRPEGKRPV